MKPIVAWGCTTRDHVVGPLRLARRSPLSSVYPSYVANFLCTSVYLRAALRAHINVQLIFLNINCEFLYQNIGETVKVAVQVTGKLQYDLVDSSR